MYWFLAIINWIIKINNSLTTSIQKMDFYIAKLTDSVIDSIFHNLCRIPSKKVVKGYIHKWINQLMANVLLKSHISQCYILYLGNIGKMWYVQ